MKDLDYLISELQRRLKESYEKKPGKTKLKRLQFIEDLVSLMPKNEMYKKYFPSSASACDMCAKKTKSIFSYVKLSPNVTPKQIRRHIINKSEIDKNVNINDVLRFIATLKNSLQRKICKEIAQMPPSYAYPLAMKMANK